MIGRSAGVATASARPIASHSRSPPAFPSFDARVEERVTLATRPEWPRARRTGFLVPGLHPGPRAERAVEAHRGGVEGDERGVVLGGAVRRTGVAGRGQDRPAAGRGTEDGGGRDDERIDPG
jgi:hypothetical protein